MSVEILSQLRKIAGKLPKTEFSKYDRPLDIIIDELAKLAPVPPITDHVFKPEVDVTDAGVEIELPGVLYSIRADPEYAPVKVNFDRPVTDLEFTVVFPGIIKQVARLTSKVFMKAPAGQVSKVRLEVLRYG